MRGSARLSAGRRTGRAARTPPGGGGCGGREARERGAGLAVEGDADDAAAVGREEDGGRVRAGSRDLLDQRLGGGQSGERAQQVREAGDLRPHRPEVEAAAGPDAARGRGAGGGERVVDELRRCILKEGRHARTLRDVMRAGEQGGELMLGCPHPVRVARRRRRRRGRRRKRLWRSSHPRCVRSLREGGSGPRSSAAQSSGEIGRTSTGAARGRRGLTTPRHKTAFAPQSRMHNRTTATFMTRYGQAYSQRATPIPGIGVFLISNFPAEPFRHL